jgi:hypothetical protein
MVLLDLPEAVSGLILMKWVRLKQVVRLDSSFCNQTKRAAFLALAYGRCSIYALNVRSERVPLSCAWRWAVSRNAKLDSLYISKDLCKTLLAGFLDGSGSAIRRAVSVRHHANCVSCDPVWLEVAKRCPNVEEVALYGEYPADPWDDGLSAIAVACQKLTSLSLTHVILSSQGLAAALARCPCLTSVLVEGGLANMPVEIAVPTLKTLKIHNVRMSDAVLAAIGQRCSELECLELFTSLKQRESHPVTDVGVRAVLQGCPLLREIDVECAQNISCQLRAELAQRCCFTKITFGTWSWLDEEVAHAVLKVSPQLRALHAGDGTWQTDETLRVCEQYCPLLEVFSIRDCPMVTIEGVRRLLCNMGSQLREVKLRCCRHLGDEGVLAIAAHCPLLRAAFCPAGTTDAAVVELAMGCPLLTWVEFSSCEVGDGGVAALAMHCTMLQELRIQRCSKLTMQGVRSVAEHCLHLVWVLLPGQFRDQQLPKFRAPGGRSFYPR